MLLEALIQDLRYGVRMLFRNAGFTFVSVFALGLGIGLNTATFTAYKAMIARPVEARDPDRMVNIALNLPTSRTATWGTEAWFSYPDYQSYRDHVRSCSGLIAWFPDHLTLSDAGRMISGQNAASGSLMGRLGLLPNASSNKEFASTFLISENYFSVLGVQLLRGRGFESMSRAELARTPAVLISENYWQKRFDGDPAMLGKTIRLNGAAFVIIGIAPLDFVGTMVAAPDFWMPLSLEPLVHPDSDRLRDREQRWLRVFGRLAPGASVREAQAEITVEAGRVRTLHDPHAELSRPVNAVVWRASPFPVKISGGLRLTVVLIMVAVGMVLAIACANVAGLQLARATVRQNELAMRLSLGANRGRLIRQLLTESVLLGLLAGSVALPVTWGLLRIAVKTFADAFPLEFGTMVFNVNPDAEIFLFVLGISAFAGLLFGLAPAIESSRSALFSSIRGNAGTAPIRSRRLRDLLIAVQVAVSLVLLISGSMLIRSAMRALGMETGYDSKHVLELSLRFPEGRGYTNARKAALVRELRARIADLPGVTAVTSARPPDDNDIRPATVLNPQAKIYFGWVEPNYLQTLGIPLRLGHGFPAHSGAEHLALLSESAAKKLWPGQNPIGRSLRLASENDLPAGGPAWQVIGVVRDARGVLPDRSDSAQVYLPLPEDRLQDFPILIRTRSSANAIRRPVEAAISSLDPDLEATISTLEEMLRQTQSFIADTLSATIATAIGLFGLLLASMGIYGTVSYIAVLRTREVGIRMAIGAQKQDIFRLMMRETTRPVLAGLLAGISPAIAAAWVLRGILYGLSMVDPVSFGGASVLFLVVALAATYPPSRRAMRVDPMVALRYE